MKRTGKIRISQMLVPLAPWIEAMPRRATSDEVSKPRPNIAPRGYMFLLRPRGHGEENVERS